MTNGSSELFSALGKWFDLLVLIREETICLPTRSQRSKLLLSPDYLSFPSAQSTGATRRISERIRSMGRVDEAANEWTCSSDGATRSHASGSPVRHLLPRAVARVAWARERLEAARFS